jgi:hypothetical protein
MQRALRLEDRNAKVSTAFQPSAHYALLLACTGRLEKAYDAFASVKRRRVEQGEHGELMFILFHTVLIEIWRGISTTPPRSPMRQWNWRNNSTATCR